MRESRSGLSHVAERPSSSGGASRRPTSPATAVTRHAPARTSSPASVPPARGDRRQREGGRGPAQRQRRLPDAERETRAARAQNQPMTARPLAAFTLAPAAPATTSRSTSARVRRRERRSRDAPGSPARGPRARTPRSPTRSVSSPHGSSVTTEPMLKAARTTPTCGEREPVLVPELRRHDRNPEEDGRVAPLRGRAEGEDRPAVAAHAARLSAGRAVEPSAHTRHDAAHTSALFGVRLEAGGGPGCPKARSAAG